MSRYTGNKYDGQPTLCAEIVLLPVLGGRHIYFRYYATSDCIGDNVVELGDIENMDVGLSLIHI